MRRTDLQDTALWAHLMLIKRVREMTPRERLDRTNALIVDLRELRRRGDASAKPRR